MNIFNICHREAQQKIENMQSSTRHQKMLSTSNRQQRNSNMRRVIESGDFLYDCPAGNNDNCVSGEVYIRRKGSSKLLFEGLYFNNQKNGFGVEYDEYGQILYQGEYKNDMKDGWGSTPMYEGRFREDQYDGWGRLTTSEVFYQGYFSEGKYHGFGIYIKGIEELNDIKKLQEQPKIDEYILLNIEKAAEKLFKDHNLEEIYLGQFSKGLKNGSGKLHKKDGQWYVGQFSYDMMHGNGTLLRHASAQIQKGTFIKGNFMDR